jgi:hypothetical protein
MYAILSIQSLEVKLLDNKLFIQAIGKYLIGLILVSVLLFIPAGTLHYWNAWLLIGVLFFPMLIVGIMLFLSMPLVLGSFFSLLIFLIYPVITVKRIRNEEEVLEKSLEGYSEYKKRIKYRLIPFIW